MHRLLFAGVVCAFAVALSAGLPAELPLYDIFPAHTNLKSYQYKNCGNSSDIGNLTELTLSPDPLVFPGDLGVEFTAIIKSKIDSGLKGSVYMAKKFGSTWVKIPCIGQIGSCDYDDVCSLLHMIQECPPPLVQAGIPCKCPFAAGTYHLPKATFSVDVPVFPSGDYKVIANLEYNSRPVACAEIFATFA